MGKLEIARLLIVVRQQSQHEVQGNTSERNRHGAEEKLRLRWHVALLSGKSSLAAELAQVHAKNGEARYTLFIPEQDDHQVSSSVIPLTMWQCNVASTTHVSTTVGGLQRTGPETWPSLKMPPCRTWRHRL